MDEKSEQQKGVATNEKGLCPAMGCYRQHFDDDDDDDVSVNNSKKKKQRFESAEPHRRMMDTDAG